MDRAVDTLKLRDQVLTYRLKLEPFAVSIQYETQFSLYYGQGVRMMAVGIGGHLVRIDLYPDHTLCHLGTRWVQGREVLLDTDAGIVEILAYLRG